MKWWLEVALILFFYLIYSFARNQFGSASVSPGKAFENAEKIIDLEKSIGTFKELQIQEFFIDWKWFIQFWNVFYGTFHFGVTIFALVWLYIKFPSKYSRQRFFLLSSTGSALIGFSLFPLMPPRLLSNCGDFGACLSNTYPFIDTLSEIGGLWSFDSGTMQKVSNQFAAMPSLHFAWSFWCTLALYPILKSQKTKILISIYPLATTFSVIVTANHYWVDLVGGFVCLGFGFYATRILMSSKLHLMPSSFRRNT
ncbi:MAG: phosphatase PAP2 family protein [Acidimicrobiales bacterium]|nr:phosphatase PAP2 family protein [Acidimicrobiales bacterium]HJL91897.1 phosphatase PAP2 family protein [Acidimicrobiales bacterium]HJO41432.1 phosphatase PAP2 family protein [Acidimicrobiales bacterium]